MQSKRNCWPAPCTDRIALLNRGIAADPDSALLHYVKSKTLSDVGRLEEAIESARRAVDLNPASTVYRQQFISALAYGGYRATAEEALKEAERIWPDSRNIQDIRARFDLRFGDPNRLLGAISSGTQVPYMPMQWSNAMFRAVLLARAQPTHENVAAAIATSMRIPGNPNPHVVLQNLVALGAIDQAYTVATNPRALNALRSGGTEILFRANMRAFRLDRRFMAVADKVGLVRFWQSSGMWPDFCFDRTLPYDCKAEIRRLHSARSATPSAPHS